MLKIYSWCGFQQEKFMREDCVCASVCKHASVRGVFRNKTGMVICKTILGTLEKYLYVGKWGEKGYFLVTF